MPDGIRRKERRNIGKTKKDRLRNARLQDTERERAARGAVSRYHPDAMDEAMPASDAGE